MLLDSTLSFDPLATALTTSRVSINVLDLGTNPSAPYAATVIFSAAFAGPNGTSLRIQVEGSVDNSTWFAVAASPALPISTINRMSLENHRFNLPIEIPVGSPTPRYYRLSYTVNAGPFTTGAVNSFLHQNRDQPTGYLFPKTNLTGQDGLSGPDGAGMVGFDALTGEYPAATIGSQLRTRMTVDGLKIGVEQDDVVAVENRAKIQEYIDYVGANGGGNI